MAHVVFGAILGLAFSAACLMTGTTELPLRISDGTAADGGATATGTGGAGEAMDGDEIIQGVLIGPGVLCPQFRLDGGEQISLESALPEGLAQGVPVRLSGRFLRASRCQQGRAFAVSGIVGLD